MRPALEMAGCKIAIVDLGVDFQELSVGNGWALD
jgi:hypothetical protein